MKKADAITAIGFLLFVAAMCVVALCHLPEITDSLRSQWAGADGSLLDKAVFVTENGEDALSQTLDPEHLFIQIYGGAQRLMGHRYVEDVVPANSVVKLGSGALSFLELGAESADPTENAQAVAALARYLGETPFLAVVAPQKIAAQSELPVGLTEYGNATADAFLSALAGEGVDALDLRPAFDARDDRDSLFFRTDHHWRPEGAFFAYQLLAEELASRYGLGTDPQCLDPGSYDWTVLPDFFLGSQGKRVGSLYAGTDDFTVVTPRFDTDFTYTGLYMGETRSGPFAQSLCFAERIAERDWFGGNPYTYYSGGDYGWAVMTNTLNPDGPKILLIRESFSCALAPFLALSCSQLVTVDMRNLDRPLQDVIEETGPDLVILLYCASSTRLPELFSWDLPE